MNKILYVFALVLFISSCVPARKYQEISDKQKTCQQELEAIRGNLQELEARTKEFNVQLEVAQRKINSLESDTSVLGNSLRILRGQYDKINALNDELLQKTTSLRQGTEAENQRMMMELNNLRNDLLAKEDSLVKLGKRIQAKEMEVLDREQKLDELRSLLQRQDSAVSALKNRVSQALLGFEGKGLTVEQRDGKIYVSLEAKLLFPSGSTKVDENGKRALIDLAKAIEDEPEMEIMVEGHTDTDKINSSAIPRNNWELSVLRSTAVIDIMTKNSNINPSQLIASGRSEFHPVDPADKAKNRRIEVIISPNLNALFEMINDGSGN